MSREARPRVEGQPVPAFAATRGARARVVGSTRASPPDARAERCGVERRSRARSSTTALFFYFSRTAASRDSRLATPAFFGFAKRSYHGSCSACRRFVCHVSGRVFRRSRLVRDAVSEKRESAQGKKKSFVQSTSFFSVFSRRTLFSLVRVSLRRSFSRRDFCASPRMPPQSRVSAQVVRNIFGRGDSEAGTQRRAGSAFDSTRARTTAHTHRRR